MNSWSPVWEEIFRSRASWNKYPPEELIRFFAAHYYSAPDRSAIKVLEVGCGPGAGGGQFIAREGFSYVGIDGSPTAIAKAKTVFANEKLKGEFQTGFIDKLPYADSSFESVIDICCLQHNSEADSAKAIAEILRVLKPGGRHFSLVSKDGNWGDNTGEKVDGTTRRAVTEGPYVGMDAIRFATRESLERLYSKFRNVELNYSIRSVEHRKHEISHWMVVAEKPL